MTAYSAGLRSSEVIRLKVSDIDGDRKLIHVRQAKGKKDRYTILSVRLIEELKHYWRYYRPQTWLFPSPVSGGSHIHENLAGRIFSKAREKAKIKKPCSMHTLRHSFATHLLENNVDVRTIQSFLGHSCLSTTMIYVKVTQKRTESIQSPLDNFQEEPDVQNPDWVKE